VKFRRHGDDRDDVVWPQSIRDPEIKPYVGWMLGSVDTIEKVDDHITVTLKNNDAFWQYVTATKPGVISRPSRRPTRDIGKPDVGVIGTGPFKFELVSGDRIVLTQRRLLGQGQRRPYLNRRSRSRRTRPRTAGLQTGELSAVIGAIPGDQLPLVQGMADVDLQLTDSYLTDFIAFNTQVPPFDNVKLRQALNHAVDKVGVRTVSLGDFAVDAKATQVGQAMWLFNADLWSAAFETLPDYAVDMEEGRRAAGESGVADQLDGKTITVDRTHAHRAGARLQDAS
jgi:peptide/nickel transport system substrate-binding protein